MAGGRGKIHEHPKVNTNGFDKRPGDAGRPKKTYTQHIEELKGKGYKAPTKGEYYEMVGLLLSMEEDDIKDFAKDKTKPYWIRLLVMDLNSSKNRSRIMSDYRDWLFGSARQQVDHTSKGEKINEVKITVIDGTKPAKTPS
jgi:hypothetical protein